MLITIVSSLVPGCSYGAPAKCTFVLDLVLRVGRRATRHVQRVAGLEFVHKATGNLQFELKLLLKLKEAAANFHAMLMCV